MVPQFLMMLNMVLYMQAYYMLMEVNDLYSHRYLQTVINRIFFGSLAHIKTPTLIFACQCPRVQGDIRPCTSIGRRSGASIQCLSARDCTCSVEGSWLGASWLHSSQRHLHSGIMSRAGQSCAPFWITYRAIRDHGVGSPRYRRLPRLPGKAHHCAWNIQPFCRSSSGASWALF